MHLAEQFEHLRIQLEAITCATNNFADDNCIGRGGFGRVYKGELVHPRGVIIVAVKRLDPTFGQGNPEFWKEIIMLSLYKHENIVSLLGFCDESNEKILVYEFASRKSLDLYLDKDDLTWIRRLKICIGVARGIAYLHNHGGTQQRVLHRDIKSSNILLDENWNVKISDLGLSKFGPANQKYTFLVSNVVGTIGYCDPIYIETGVLTKESDVYSFGVVLFEVLCGRLCISNKNGIQESLIGLVRHYYPQNKINEIIYGNIKDGMNPKSLEIFTTIAYRCLKREPGERPLMTEVVSILESALEYQLGLHSSDATHNPNESTSYEQGNTRQEKSDLTTTTSPLIITQFSQVLVCIVCDMNSRVWEVFDPVRNKWMRLPEITTDRDIFNYSRKNYLAVGSELLVFGRQRFRFANWKYSLVQQNWSKCDGMHHPRCFFGSGTLGSIAIVAGGSDQNGNILNSAELYDSSSGSWERLPNMHSPRTSCAGFFMDEKFYVVGGITADSFDCGEEFDLKTKKWRKIDGMFPYKNTVADGRSLVAVVSNELYAVDILSNMVIKYNKKENSWEVLGRLPARAALFHGCGIAFKACGEGLLVVGAKKRRQRKAIFLNYWSPKCGVKNGGILDWKVIGVKEDAGTFVYDCAVIGG